MDEAVRQFPPSEALAFVAIGYHECNNVRAERMTDLASAGYMLASLVSPRAYVPSNFVANANCLITDGAVVQTGARLGMGCFVFGNAVVGHHASIGKAVWIASGAAIGGGASIGDHSFIGLNATIGNEVKLGRRSIVGGGALITRSVPDETVLVAPESERLRVDTTRFLRFTNLQ